MLNVLYALACRVFCIALIGSLSDGLVAFFNNLSGDMDYFQVVDHFLDISVAECWTDCGRHMSCAHAVYERRYRLCTLLEGPDTSPIPTAGFVVASKGSENIVVS